MWNTYSTGELNSLFSLPDQVCLRIGIYDKTQKFLLDKMLWRNNAERSHIYENIKRFGLHAEDGSYWDIDFQYRDFSYSMETATDGPAFACRLTPRSNEDGNIVFFISAVILGQKTGTISILEDGFKVITPRGEYDIRIHGETEPETFVNCDMQGVVIKADRTLVITCNTNMSYGAALIEKNRQNHVESRADSGGFLAHVSDAMQKAVIWNTIYDGSKDRLCIPVSRAWCVQNGKSFGSYVLFEWDTFFTSVMTSSFNHESAKMQAASVIGEMTPGGMIPNFGSQRGGSPDRSQPPVGSYCILKLYRQTNDITLLEEHYSKLLIWNSWWMKNRDGNADGLLEWGSNPNPNGLARGYFDEGNTMLCAMYESGLDNSPMYDDVTFNFETHTMELNDVGLNALYALDCQCLAEIASLIGKCDDMSALLDEYERIKILMNERMYDEDKGMYCNLHWDGTKDYRFSPTNFYPLLARVASERQAKRMVNEHLLNPDEFWGEYVIPSISKEIPAHADQEYWRGRVWAPMNFLVYEGLKQYPELGDAAFELAKKSKELFMREWLDESHVHENYNSITGDGDDVGSADPFYTWGSLLAYIAMCELIYVRAGGGVRIGSSLAPESYIKNYLIGEDVYNLDTRGGFVLERNGKAVIRSGKGLVVEDFKLENGELSFKIMGGGGGATVYPSAGINKLTVIYYNGQTLYSGVLADAITINTK